MKQPQLSYQIEDAITPLDGRNRHKIAVLASFFSEYALNKNRLKVEINYLFLLSKHSIFSLKVKDGEVLKAISRDFTIKEYEKMKQIEEKINHDVKAVEYYLRGKLEEKKLDYLIPFIHLGLTSEDVNNLAYGLSLKLFKEQILEKELQSLIRQLFDLTKQNKNIPMLARTHGQPAVTTTVGKEFSNYYFRLKKLFNQIKLFSFEGKCNGAVGNNNALCIVLPQHDWMKIGEEFVSHFGFVPNRYTTQILPYDNWLQFFQLINLVNGILVDFSINIWQYIMLSVFVQKRKKGEVGSSTMPHKINPIRFEHAEGSLQLANSMFDFFVRKLTSSRLQRDLSDSTVRRSFGEAFGYSLLGWQSIALGLETISVNEIYLTEELDNHWEILAEAVQTYLRVKKDMKAYEKLKTLTQGKTINKKEYFSMLKELGLDGEKRLTRLTPATYVGNAKDLVDVIKN